MKRLLPLSSLLAVAVTLWFTEAPWAVYVNWADDIVWSMADGNVVWGENIVWG
jgi:hypothetical protein